MAGCKYKKEIKLLKFYTHSECKMENGRRKEE